MAYRLLSGVEIPDDWAAYSTQQNSQFEIVHRPLWNVQTFVSNSTVNLKFFTSIPATVDLGNEAFPLKNSYLCASVGVYFIGNAVENQAITAVGDVASRQKDLLSIINTGWLAINIGNKDYGPFPIPKLISGMGLWGMIATGTTTALADYQQIGVPDPRAMFKLAIPLVLPMSTRITMEMNWAATITTTATAPKIMLILDGKEARPLQ